METRTKYFLWTLSAIVMLMTASPANAVATRLPGGLNLQNPNIITVATKCTKMIRRGNNETLINQCATCRLVGLMRQRAGNALPVRRQFTIASKSQFPVPFRGPGRSRITSDTPCKGEVGSNKNLVNPQQSRKAKPEKKCVELKQGSRGNVVLVNSCQSCRGVAIQRMNLSGHSLGQQAYKLHPQAIVAIKAKGAARVQLVGEVACPKS